MANPLIQYFRDTRAELHHVAWPTHAQTVIYAVLIAIVSIVVAIYLGAFDLLFTSTLGRFLGAVPQNIPAQVQELPGATATSAIQIGAESDRDVPAIDIADTE